MDTDNKSSKFLKRKTYSKISRKLKKFKIWAKQLKKLKIWKKSRIPKKVQNFEIKSQEGSKFRNQVSRKFKT